MSNIADKIDIIASELSNLRAVVLGVSGTPGCRARSDKRNEDHEMRIRKLEIAQAKVGVVAGLVSGGVVAGITMLAKQLLGG